MLRPLILTLLLAACSGGGTETDTSVQACDDGDADGVCDVDDACIGDDASGDSDTDGVCDSDDVCTGDDADGDADLDGICDGANDACVGDDATGDTDVDGVCDDRDVCTGDDALGDADQDGICDGSADLCFGDDATGDTDADGVCDNADQCTGDDATGDADFDGTCDDADACTGDDNTGDSDTDGVCDDQDACTGDDGTNDTDGDGVCDDLDFCTGNDATGDADSDGVCDDVDACVGDDASGNIDGDGRCDDIDDCNGTDEDDDDGDGICNSEDTCIGPDAAGDPDGDNYCGGFDRCVGDDGVGDFDNDGFCDDTDLCIGDNGLADGDGDGICDGDFDRCVGDDATGDSDGDGICDDTDVCYGNNDFGHDRGDGVCGAGVIWYVRGGSSSINRGRSWSDAFGSLDQALGTAEPGDTVFVDVGTRTSLGFDSVPPIADGVQLIGGFTNGEAHPDERTEGRDGYLAAPTPIENSPGLAVQGGVVDGFRFSGNVAPSLLLGSGSHVANVVLDTPDTRVASPALTINTRSSARVARVRCTGFSALAGPCIGSEVGGTLVLDDLRVDGMSNPSRYVLRFAGGTARIRDVFYENAERSLMHLSDGAIVDLIGGRLDSIEPRGSAVAFQNGSSELNVTDLDVLATGVSESGDAEGGLFYVTGSTLTLERVNLRNNDVIYGESLAGGIVYANNATVVMTDSAVHDTTISRSAGASGGSGPLGGLFYLGNSQSLFMNVSLEGPTGPASEATSFHVAGGEWVFGNSVLYDTSTGPVFVGSGTNTEVGALCATPLVIESLGPSTGVRLTGSPWSSADTTRLFLDPSSPCIDAGEDVAADDAGVWWPGRVSAAGQGIDLRPVDLGVHYDDDVSR